MQPPSEPRGPGGVVCLDSAPLPSDIGEEPAPAPGAALEAQVLQLEVPPPPLPPPPPGGQADGGPRTARGGRVVDMWYGHAIAEVVEKTRGHIGYGILCGRHTNVDDDLECKKQLTFGKDGRFDGPTCIRKLKQWIIEGYKIDNLFNSQTKHVRGVDPKKLDALSDEMLNETMEALQLRERRLRGL
jgi:hypothetical protein